MKGRKSIPSKIIDLRGGTAHTHKKPRDQEPQPPEKMPDCPEHLDEIARTEWERAGKLLMDVRIMTELDMAMLTGYAVYFSQWCIATIQLQEKGMVYKKTDGTPGWNPYFRVANDCYDRMIRAAVLLGLAPSSRVNLKVNRPKEKGKAALFMARKNG